MIEKDRSETSLVDRVQARIAHGLDEFFHPVSREAQRQLTAIADQIPDTPLGESLKTVEPRLREVLKYADTGQAIRNILTGLFFQVPGAVFLLGSGIHLRDKAWLSAAATSPTMAA